ncbi:MAG: tetratricopeptide repeat protein [Nevskia sp.]|nr:tetratricopeptide repeat protein [Nevskia sp.]
MILLSLAACGSAADRKASYIAHGEKYLAASNFEKARVEFRNALQIDPKDSKAHFLLGRAAEKLNDPRDAFGHYQAAVDLNPKDLDARAALARLLVLGGAPEKAVEVAEPGLAQDPNNAQLLTARGAARAKLGDMKSAVQDAENAVRLAPEDDYAVSLLAALYRTQDRTDDAVKVVTAALERLPGNVDLHVELADLYVQKHPDLAEAELKKAIELDPKNLSRRYNLVRFYEFTNNADAGEKALRDTIALAPDDVSTKIMLVSLLAQKRGPEQAEAQMQQFIKAEPDNDQLKLALAEFQQRQNRPEQAQANYEAIIAHAGIKPDGLTARDRLAELMLQRNDGKRAQALIDEVLKENPRDNDALLIRAHMALERGDLNTAITDLRTVLHDRPNAAPVLRLLAKAHLQNGEPALAEESLRAAVQASPDDVDSRFDLAQVLEQTGKMDQARPILEQLAAGAPDNARLVEELFKVQMTLNDIPAARTTAKKYQEKHPELALGFYLAGLADENDHKSDAAIADYEHALAAQPQGSEPLAALVHQDVAHKQAGKAMQRLDDTIAKYPDNMFARNLKGEMLLAQGQFDAAAQVFQDAITRQPGTWMLYRGLARARLALKQNDAAVQALSQGVEKNPDAAALVTDQAELYERLGRPDDAIAAYEQALKRQPSSQLFANNLAMLLVTVKQDPSSLARARQLVQPLENSPLASYMDTRGWVQYKSGSYDNALALLQQASERAPKDPVLRYHLGMAQYKSGDSAHAEANLSEAVKSGMKFAGLDEAQATLDQLRRVVRQ